MPDRVKEHDAIVWHELVHLGKELAVSLNADMFEHADRNDPVELLGKFAIVAQFKADAVADPGLSRPFPGEGVLFLRQRDAKDLDVLNLAR